MSSEEFYRIVYTCGVCETIVEDYVDHECLEGYSCHHIDENYYFYPVTDDGKIIRRSQMDDGSFIFVEDEIHSARGTENVCPNKQSSTSTANAVPLPATKRKRPAEHCEKLDDLDIELLILEVQRRLPLWNFTLPIQERSREIVAKLWGEVSTALNGKISVAVAKKKFKNLKDAYKKIIKAEQYPSGSGRATPKEKWKFYDQMSFLRDVCLIQTTRSNVNYSSNQTPNDQEDEQEECEAASVSHQHDEINEGGNQPPGATPNKKKRRGSRDDESLEVLNRIADSMCRDESVSTPPPAPQMDDVDGLLVGVATYLRRMTHAQRMATIIEILNIVYQRYQQYGMDS